MQVELLKREIGHNEEIYKLKIKNMLEEHKMREDEHKYKLEKNKAKTEYYELKIKKRKIE